MSTQESRGPFCQSCSMPLRQPEDFGTDANGYRINDYCHHCYRDGSFLQPNVTMTEMIDFCTTIMARQGIMPEAQARAMLVEVMPRLRRWRSMQPAGAEAGGRGLMAGDELC